MGHPGFWPCPPRAVPIGWPERQRSTSHVAKMLNQFERMELDVIDCARTIVPRHPRSARLLAGEFQYSCNRCLCVHSGILTHRRGQPEAPTYQCCCCRIARGRSAMRSAVEHVRSMCRPMTMHRSSDLEVMAKRAGPAKKMQRAPKIDWPIGEKLKCVGRRTGVQKVLRSRGRCSGSQKRSNRTMTSTCDDGFSGHLAAAHRRTT